MTTINRLIVLNFRCSQMPAYFVRQFKALNGISQGQEALATTSAGSISIRKFSSCTPTGRDFKQNVIHKGVSICDVLNFRKISLSDTLYMTGDSGMEESELKKEIESLTDQFMEARELMEDARESEGTVYFSDDVEDAQKAVKETLEGYQILLSKLSDSQRQQVMRAIGLKMEELKAQLIAMEEELKEEH